jgi:hypothetical protein
VRYAPAHPEFRKTEPLMSAPAPRQSTDIHAKALAINLEASCYGTYAEIGAGQEVARWSLSVGAASGTVAQAISAYDKTVSDDTYGAGTRYVSKERLLAMLDHEYQLLLARLAKDHGPISDFSFLRTPSPPGITREPTSSTAGSASGSRPNLMASPIRLFSTSIWEIPPPSFSSRPLVRSV